MRKFIVKKKWPGGPEVGTIGEMGLENVSFAASSNYGRWHTPSELEGFVEEIKEPEEFWFIGTDGLSYNVVASALNLDVIPSWLRFRSKKSAEQFAKALKDSHKLETIEYGESYSGTLYIQEKGPEDGRAEIEDLIDALNDRVGSVTD